MRLEGEKKLAALDRCSVRTLTKPSTALSTLEHYTAFLLAKSQSAGCVRLAEVSGGGFAHNVVNRFLNREQFIRLNVVSSQ